MNQLEANRKSAVLKFTNIDSEDFVHSFNGDPWVIKLGESMYFPVKQARLFAKHLAMKIINRTKKLTAEGKMDGTILYKPSDMEQLVSKILGPEYEVPPQAQKTEQQIHREKVEEINKTLGREEKTSGYMSKAEVIAKLTEKGVKFDPKNTREQLLSLLSGEPASAIAGAVS